jgi:hypothetical protein
MNGHNTVSIAEVAQELAYARKMITDWTDVVRSAKRDGGFVSDDPTVLDVLATIANDLHAATSYAVAFVEERQARLRAKADAS